MATTDPTAVAHAVHELEKAMLHIFASKCLAVAGVSILAYDHILTFPQEVELIWKQKRSWVSVLFVLNRYITPLVLIVDVYDKGGLANYLSQSFCVNWYYAESMWNLISFGLIHALVALRVHAIWGRPRWLSITLCTLFALYFVITATVAIKFEIEFAHTVAYNPLFRLCFAQVSPYLWTCWLPALVFESFIFILTIIKAVEHSNNKVNTPVVHVLYRDGIVYFIIISICSVFNMMVWLLAPPTLVALSKYFVLSVVPTMGARLVLNLRGSRREDIMPTGRSTSGDDNAAYEMHHPKSATSGGTSSNGRGVIFISHSPGAALSVQDRVQLNQIKPNSNYYRLKDGKAHMV